MNFDPFSKKVKNHTLKIHKEPCGTILKKIHSFIHKLLSGNMKILGVCTPLGLLFLTILINNTFRINPSLPLKECDLFVQFYTRIQKLLSAKLSIFGSIMAQNSTTVRTLTPNINSNLLVVKWNILVHRGHVLILKLLSKNQMP